MVSFDWSIFAIAEICVCYVSPHPIINLRLIVSSHLLARISGRHHLKNKIASTGEAVVLVMLLDSDPESEEMEE